MSDGEDGQQDAEGGSDNEGGEPQRKGISNKRIGQIVTVAVGICVSAFGFWPDHRFLALALPVPLFFGMMLHDGAQPMRVSAILTGILALILTVVYLKLPPPPPQIGWLQPAGEPTPPNTCDGAPRTPDSVLVLLGSSAYISDSGSAPTALLLGSCSVVSIQPGPNGAEVSAEINDKAGDQLALVKNNKFVVGAEKHITLERSGDLSTLVVHGYNDKELLYVKSINEKTFRVRGIFNCPGAAAGTVTVTDTEISTVGSSTMCAAYSGKAGIGLGQ